MSIIIKIIVAMAENGVIGNNNKIPWNLSSDLKRFAELTTGHTLIVGRKTHESIIQKLGHPLPNRKTIVITRQKNYSAPECEIASSWEEAKSIAGTGEIFVIGGAEVYSLAIPEAETIYLTIIHCSCKGDAFFPKYNAINWKEEEFNYIPPSKNGEYGATFKVLKKIL